MSQSRPISGVLGHTRIFPDFAISQTSYSAGAQLSPHCHAEPILSFAIAGGTSVSVAGKTEWCDEGSLLYLPAGVPHANSYPGAAVRLHIEVVPGFWKRIAGKRAVATSRVIRHPITRQLQRSIVSPIWNTDPAAEITTSTYLADLIGLIAANKKRKGESFPAQWLLRLRDFLDANCAEQLGMQELVEVSGRHPVHISREFRRHFGKTITEFVRTRRVMRAAKLIAQDSQSLASIALECGFCDQSHFTNAFRRHTRMAPSQFRHNKVAAKLLPEASSRS
jgi:AraC family transcriptional regulator